jgi:hypothetical protein
MAGPCRSLQVNFAPKGGPTDLAGRYHHKTGRLVWADNNTWTKSSSGDDDDTGSDSIKW